MGVLSNGDILNDLDGPLFQGHSIFEVKYLLKNGSSDKVNIEH